MHTYSFINEFYIADVINCQFQLCSDVFIGSYFLLKIDLQINFLYTE